VIDVDHLSDTYSQRIVAACEKTLKRLKFQLSECAVPWVTLRTLTDSNPVNAPASLLHCPELRELEFSELYPTQIHLATISTITSINIWKITFSRYSSPILLHIFSSHHCWTSFDDYISTLADKLRKLGSKKTLEVEFQSEYLVVDSLPVDYKRFLPKFREKGRVRIADPLSRWVLELPVCFHSPVSCYLLTRIPANCLTGPDA